MKFINPSVEIWEQDVTTPETLVEAMWAHIARCVRVCYQVDKPKNDETEEEYVKRVIFRKPEERLANHYSVLEHGAVYLKVPVNIDPQHSHWLVGKLWENKYTKRKLVDEGKKSFWYFSTNLRVIVENNILNAFDFMVPFNPEHHYRRVTVSFITNIGVARELNRHRTHSISEESTRYCDYSKDRFGNELTFVVPTWYTGGNGKNDRECSMDSEFELTCEEAEKSYKRMISWGATPQQAREILPLATKVQTIHTAFIDDWWDFLKLRHDEVSGPAHPNAKIIADMLSDKLHCIFSNNG